MYPLALWHFKTGLNKKNIAQLFMKIPKTQNFRIPQTYVTSGVKAL